METLKPLFINLLIFGIYPLVLFWKSKKQNISYIEAYHNSSMSWRLVYGSFCGMIICSPIAGLILGTTMLEIDAAWMFYQVITILLTIGIVFGGGITRFLQIRYMAQKHYIGIMDEYYNINLAKRMILSILYISFFCVPIVWLVMSNSFYGKISMGTEPLRFLGRVILCAFSIGAILGVGITLLLNKHHNESNSSTKSRDMTDCTTNEKIQQISKLKELFDAGALTEEEYSAEKTKILNS